MLERFFDETGGMQLVRALAVRRPGQPRARARAAQEVLPHLQLRAAGRGERRRHRAVARPAPQLPARARCPATSAARTVEDTLEHAILDSPMFQSRWRWNLNRSLHGAAVPQRAPQPAADPAHGVRRPHGRGVPAGGGVPGERHRPDRDPRPRARAPDHQRHAARGARRRRPARAARAHGVGRGRGALRRHHRAVGARARDHHRPARTRSSTTRSSRTGAPTRSRCAAACSVDLAAIGALDPEAIEQVHGEITPEPESADDLARPAGVAGGRAARAPSGSRCSTSSSRAGARSVFRPRRHRAVVHGRA